MQAPTPGYKSPLGRDAPREAPSTTPFIQIHLRPAIAAVLECDAALQVSLPAAGPRILLQHNPSHSFGQIPI